MLNIGYCLLGKSNDFLEEAKRLSEEVLGFQIVDSRAVFEVAFKEYFAKEH